jgi:hypothetical protein
LSDALSHAWRGEFFCQAWWKIYIFLFEFVSLYGRSLLGTINSELSWVFYIMYFLNVIFFVSLFSFYLISSFGRRKIHDREDVPKYVRNDRFPYGCNCTQPIRRQNRRDSIPKWDGLTNPDKITFFFFSCSSVGLFFIFLFLLRQRRDCYKHGQRPVGGDSLVCFSPSTCVGGPNTTKVCFLVEFVHC